MRSGAFRFEGVVLVLLTAASMSVFSGCATSPSSAQSPGKFLDHDTTAANGGVSNYGDGLTTAASASAARASKPAAEKAFAGAALESLSKELFFGSGSANLNRKQRKDLDRVAEMMKNHPEWKLSLIGHADPHGPVAVNKKLSLRRANSVKKALTDDGVPVSRLDVHAMGEVAESNPSDAARLALDRNVEIRLKNE